MMQGGMTDESEKVGRRSWREHVPLIERAARALTLGERRSASEPAARTDDQPTAPNPAPRPVRPQARPVTRTERRSRYAQIDLQRLQEQGFVTPDLTGSRTKEEFRVIKRSVLQRAFDGTRVRGKHSNLVMVTSARPGEGKTFTALNLAISIASERDYTVLLVDADFTSPTILKTLRIEADQGFIDVIGNPDIDLSEVLIRTNIDKLTVLPAGRSHNLSTELLGSQRMKDVVDEIARRYHDRIVIFDAPPILSTSEPSVMATHMGQILFVIEADKTLRSVVRQALDMIDDGPSIGLVLNRTRPPFGHAHFGSYYKR